MNRTFNARVTGFQYLFLLLLGGLTLFLLWDKAILPATGCMLLLVFVIERVIHTTYIVTDAGELILSTGRFGKAKRIRISDIRSVKHQSTLKIGKACLATFILIEYSKEKYVSVMPVKEQEFIAVLEKKRKHSR